jgi:hypothetical protein
MKTTITGPLPNTIPEVIQAVVRAIKDESMTEYEKRGDILYLMGVLQAIHNEIEMDGGIA